MEFHKLTPEQQQMLDAPLPAEAVSPHPTKNYLSTIKAIYVTERLNKVFGVGVWRVKSEEIARDNKMVVVKVTFEIPEYGTYYECYGGNDNTDLGDAYKGAVTDALTKIGSWLGIGADVFKGLAGKPASRPATQLAGTSKRKLTAEVLNDSEKCDKFLMWMYGHWVNAGYPETFDVRAQLLKSYDADDDVVKSFIELFNSYKQARNGK